MKFRTVSAMVAACAILLGCTAQEIVLVLPDGGSKVVQFYSGDNHLDDLIIVDGVNYFGKAEYQMNDKLGDIGFRFNDGKRVQAECTEIGKDIIGEDECKLYTVYRSTFDLIPVGTKSARPK